MDRESNFNEYFTNILSDFTALKTSYVEAKNNLKTLENFVLLLREELRISRDAERTADFKKNCTQEFLTQQQEVINKLLGVREENESLKQSMKHLETTKKYLVDECKAEREKWKNEIEQLKTAHVKEILMIRENADEEVMKAKEENAVTIASLKLNCAELTQRLEAIKSEKDETINTTVQKFQERMTKLNDRVTALQSENKELKERSATNIAIFQKKLAEQECQHQAELETWKRAEINRTPITQNPIYKPSNFPSKNQMPSSNFPVNSVNHQYVTNPMLYQNQSFYQQPSHKPPLNVTMSKKLAPTYQTANEIYRQNQNESIEVEDLFDDESPKEDNKEELKIIINKTKPKFPAAVKKRKLYNGNNSDWAD